MVPEHVEDSVHTARYHLWQAEAADFVSYRYALNLKGLEYKTEWVEYPDIEGVLKKLGAPPTGKKSDGRDHYTLPVIYDPTTKRVVEDSAKIAKYLDETYPDGLKLFPAGTDAFQAAFHDFIWEHVGHPLLMLAAVDTTSSLLPRSQIYFRSSREEVYGKRLEELGTEEEWQKFEAGLEKLRGYLEGNREGNGLLLMGARSGITYSDIQFAGMLVWAKVVWGEESQNWKRLVGLHGGKWDMFYAQFSKFEQVDI
ncbi:uncharacterized protein PHACADRAFT_261998 [Phanerochaete carnosa HHB-10118-sp]|uniref:GST N-terminal domain-containing protein n=1 Tax=Phanerochaete carnosa (strain HHB-10118-sp) TaxID=650164 RepID=K5WMZ6_PHACS|nr:uncharacterized protein PHACADRAFT_261998 [Phanerochaete carnosa HHB-10118-sp]EKM51702.1 hypothetical protein PHACADRAFT_261998 [Phanerochaete carnosa HHB-10118-sp]